MRRAAVIYTRVSTKEQVENLSLGVQERVCRDYAGREGLEVARVFREEGESAKTADRTELQVLLAYCRTHKATVGFVVVHSLSRFSRDTRAHHALVGLLAGWGIALRSATEPISDTPTGRLMESVVSAMAQFENDVKAGRTREGMQAALRMGRWCFPAPLGYLPGARGGPSLEPDPERADAVRSAFEDFAAGRHTRATLLRAVTARGLTTRKGRPVAAAVLDTILANPLYAGRVEVAAWGIAVSGDFAPLVSEATFARAQARLAGGREVVPHKDNPDFPLRGFVRCGDCGNPLTACWTRGRSGARYGYYQCPRCGGVRVSKPRLEGAFVDLLARLQPRPEFARLWSAVVRDVWRRRTAAARAEREGLERRVTGLREKLDRVGDLLADGVLDPQGYQRQRNRLREQLALAEVAREEATDEHLDVEAILAFAETALCDAARLWECAGLEHKQRLQRAFFAHGLVWDRAPGGARSGRGFQTAATSLCFKPFDGSQDPDYRLVTRAGIEPATPCLKGRCSTD